MSEEKNCYNCAYCEDASGGALSGLRCFKNVEHFYPDGLPDIRICDSYLQMTGISIKEKLGDGLCGLMLLMKSRGFSEEMMNEYIEKDSALLRGFGRKEE